MIDPVVIGATIGVGGVLAGTLLTSLFNHVREGKVIASAKDRDRAQQELAIRRDIYIPATKAISCIQTFINSIPAVGGFDAERLQQLYAAVHDLSPAYLVARSELVDCLAALSNVIQEEIGKHALPRTQVESAIRAATRAKGVYEFWDGRLRNALTDVSNARAGAVEESRLKSIQAELDEVTAQHEASYLEMRKAEYRRAMAQLELQAAICDSILPIGSIATEAAIHGRVEMGIATDVEHFRSTLNTTYAQSIARNRTLIASTRSLLQAANADWLKTNASSTGTTDRDKK